MGGIGCSYHEDHNGARCNEKEKDENVRHEEGGLGGHFESQSNECGEEEAHHRDERIADIENSSSDKDSVLSKGGSPSDEALCYRCRISGDC